MKIKTYDDILKIDVELAGLFLRPDMAVNWIYAVENGVKKLVEKHNNKQILDVLRYVSERDGILGKEGKDGKIRLRRESFAKVLLKFCPGAFKEMGDANALKSSMAHYQFASILKSSDNLPSGHVMRQDIKDVEDMLANRPIDEAVEPPPFSITDKTEEYLRSVVDDSKWPRSVVCVRPQYDGAFPSLSVETYHSESMFHNHTPSHIEAYEIVEDVLSKSKLNELTGVYYDKREYIKLFVVSTKGLLPDVRALATERNIGYVRINPNEEMSSNSYVLPRSIEDYAKQEYDLEVLTGTKPMTTPLLIIDGDKPTSSLVEVMERHGVYIKPHLCFRISYLHEEEIEIQAEHLTRNDVKERLRILRTLKLLSKDLSIDPFIHGEVQGVNIDVHPLSDKSQLGLFVVNENHIILNSIGLSNFERFRFTMAHELGHFVLHARWFEKMGVTSIGESSTTLSINKHNDRRLEYQANRFASYFLMPRELVISLYALCFHMFVHLQYGDRLRPLYYSPRQRETWSSYNNVVGNMSRLLGVSMEAMKIRLVDLHLLIIGS